MAEITLSQRLSSLLDGSPLTAIQRWLWVLSTGGTLLDGFVIFVLGVAMPLIIAHFHLTPDVVGLIGASLVFGAVFGAGLGGPMADHLGRKKLMLADMIIIAAGAAISAVANGFPMLFIGQLLVGVGVGIDFPASSSYVSEVLPKRSRSRMMVATIACQSVGMLLAAMITLVLLKNVHSAQNWRLFLAAEGVIAILFFLLRLSQPDSPHWLMTQRRFAEAAQAFIRIMPEQRAAVLQITGNAGEQRVANAIAPAKPGVAILFSRAYRAQTVLVAAPWFLMDIATYGVGLFTPIILGAIDFSSESGGLIAHDFADARGSAAIDLFLLLGFLVGIWVVPRFGRIRMQAIGFASMAFGMLLLVIAVRLSNSSLHIPLVFAGFILFNLLMNAGPNSTTFTLAPILFPTELRATASGFAAGVAKIGATLGVFVLPILKGKFGVPAVLGMMAAVSVLGLFVTLVFGHEDTE
ncbi:MAG TPA: MFS transporter [Candidatus Binatia bacterium]|nr:MFS transporter [Candidatus Binatia bacterium]